MFTHTTYNTMSHAMLDFSDPLSGIHQRGQVVNPRGIPTREVTNAHFSIANAVDFGLPIKINRGLSIGLAAVEAAQNLACVSFPLLAIKVAPSLRRFADYSPNGWPFFAGAYSTRIGHQFQSVSGQLKADPETRQAVISMWEEVDRLNDFKDRPCATEMQFLQRDGVLDLHVYMRSNDVFKGFCYDVFQFAQMQAALANINGWSVGAYHHTAASFHVYEDEVEKLAKLTPFVTGWERMPTEPDYFRSGPFWREEKEPLYKSVLELNQRFQAMLQCLEDGNGFDVRNNVEDWYFNRINGAIITQLEKQAKGGK